MKIAMVASEANPLAKTGGLADVVYSLSEEFVKNGEETIIIMPYYGNFKGMIRENIEKVASYSVYLSWRIAYVEAYKTVINGITYYLLDNQQYFNRGHLYGDYDDGERFAFFTLAAKALFSHINFAPDIIHIHDWQPGMLPCLIKSEKPREEIFKNTKFVLTIHNPAFQGLCARNALSELYNLPVSLYDDGTVRFNGQVSTLKSAIMFSDKITTVSPTHRNELLNEETSMGLSNVIRLREWDFCGFLNGIDNKEFDPENDEKILQKFNKKSFYQGKEANKKDLLQAFRLEENDQPVFALVSRLTWQKGVDLLIPACYHLASKGCKVIVLGSGEYNAEQEFERLRGTYPENVGIYIGYNSDLAHKIYAGSDLFLMPSLFEPCGIGQMIAQRYGTLPIVRRTGGLKDSVIGFNEKNAEYANGFSFDDYKASALINTCDWILDIYYNRKDLFNKLAINALETNNSWSKSCELYLGLYKSLLG